MTTFLIFIITRATRFSA